MIVSALRDMNQVGLQDRYKELITMVEHIGNPDMEEQIRLAK